MGDFNIDLMTCDRDESLDYIACAHRYMFYPVINRPTRLASASLLDHILTNSLSGLTGSSFISGVIMT
jgi:hypothetical protein